MRQEGGKRLLAEEETRRQRQGGCRQAGQGQQALSTHGLLLFWCWGWGLYIRQTCPNATHVSFRAVFGDDVRYSVSERDTST